MDSAGTIDKGLDLKEELLKFVETERRILEAVNRVISAMWNEDTLSSKNIERRKREVTEFVIRVMMV